MLLADDWIAFLRSRRDAGTPVWRRLRIIGSASAPKIPNVAGKIDLREPDVNQAFRLAVPAVWLAYRTEKSCVAVL